ncbi:hypothetical protein L6452_36360 [Arctium lappa]|uniref:Uncharacterized protein n=1 Tax=Arctium lappa TaxID=4217 RepID=A0ACB8Y8D8_ARCLA|nr:hypothetical protein L6452_36360 [Arctium lappa]
MSGEQGQAVDRMLYGFECLANLVNDLSLAGAGRFDVDVVGRLVPTTVVGHLVYGPGKVQSCVFASKSTAASVLVAARILLFLLFCSRCSVLF